MDRITNRQARRVVYTAIVLFCTGVSPGVDFAGGTGEPNDPYEIATAEQLIAIGSDPHLIARHFVLVADIDMPDMVWPEPVIPSFAGSFDGDGHAIRRLKARGAGPQGLFGQIGQPGRIRNLRIVGADLTGTSAVGTLAAYNAGTVDICSCDARIVATGYDAGGLVGSNSGTVTGSHCEADVVGSVRVGGLVGSNARGIISDCHSTAAVLGSAGVGGLVGDNNGVVLRSYSDGRVAGEITVGGLLGSNSGVVSGCYSTGDVAGFASVGGLAGHSEGKVSRCYSTAAVAVQGGLGDIDFGGLAGRAGTDAANAMRDSHFLAPTDGGGPDNGIGVPLTAAQMAQQASYSGWAFWEIDTGGTEARWFMPMGSPPVLAWQTEITGLRLVPDVSGLSLDRARAALVAAGFAPGAVSYDHHRVLSGGLAIHTKPTSVVPVGSVVDLVLSAGTAYEWGANPGQGTEIDPYRIETSGQLESLADHPELWDRHFVLTADLDLAGRTYSTALIAPDAGRTDDFQGVSFAGMLDGQDHVVRNFVLRADVRPYVGLFGMVGQTSRIRRLHLRDATVMTPAGGSGIKPTPVPLAGVLVAYNEGTLVDCSVTDSVLIGGRSADGLVGANFGTVLDCHADVLVVATPGGTPHR